MGVNSFIDALDLMRINHGNHMNKNSKVSTGNNRQSVLTFCQLPLVEISNEVSENYAGHLHL